MGCVGLRTRRVMENFCINCMGTLIRVEEITLFEPRLQLALPQFEGRLTTCDPKSCDDE